MGYLQQIWAWIASIPSIYFEVGGTALIVVAALFIFGPTRRWMGSWLRHAVANILYWGVILSLIYGFYWVMREYAWQIIFSVTIDGALEHFRVGHVPLLMLYAYLLGSIRVIPAAQVASQRFLELPFRHLNSGPAFVPRWICSLAFFDGADQQKEHPEEPQNLFHEDGDQPVPEGKVPPLRITFAQGAELDANRDPLNRRITAVVTFTTAFAINNAARFERTFGNAGVLGRDAIREANRQLTDTGTRFLTDIYAGVTLAAALLNKQHDSEALDLRIETVSNGWGVDMKRAEIKAIGLNHELNRSIVAVPTAVNDAEAERARAAGDRDATIRRAEGDREQRRLRGLGDGEAVRAYADQTGIEPEDSQAAEIARRFADGGNTVIMGGGGQGNLMQQIMGATFAGDAQLQQRRRRRRNNRGNQQRPGQPAPPAPQQGQP